MSIRNAITQLLLPLCTSFAVICCLPPSSSAQERSAEASNNNAAAHVVGSKPARIRFVSSSQAEVMAGPGEAFYPTCVLSSGQSIEVHQETEDGWLAITPPAGSFSWLPAAQGLLLPGGRIVEVTEKSAVSWIGTSLGTAKQYRWQVKLERGQQLAVIGERSINDSATGSQTLWYKIAPPPGEYRWIQAKATSAVAPANATATATGSSAVPTSIASNEDHLDSNDSQVIQASATEPTSVVNSQRATAAPAARAVPHRHVDRWADWHAVEFKNGSFSFPGLSRMLGMQPAAPAAVASTHDPFDLTANYTRTRTNRPAPPLAEQMPSDDAEATLANDTNSQMAVRQSRGWRDPRQLREDRKRSSLVETPGLESALESALAVNEPAIGSEEISDATYLEDTAVGTSVITAGAIEPRRDYSSPEQSWFGIDQAPTQITTAPAALADAGLDGLQLELSAMVAGPEHTWNLAPLALRAQHYIEHGRDSLERGRARLLLERIESFAQLARQSSAVGRPVAVGHSQVIPASAAANYAGSNATTASWVAPASSSNNATGDPTNAKFDATGWLVPVHSNGRDMPTHALTNDAGRIIVYVTPAPGVNLTRFESQAIGVFGLRGYLPQLKSNHVQIQRVVRLQ